MSEASSITRPSKLIQRLSRYDLPGLVAGAMHIDKNIFVRPVHATVDLVVNLYKNLTRELS